MNQRQNGAGILLPHESVLAQQQIQQTVQQTAAGMNRDGGRAFPAQMAVANQVVTAPGMSLKTYLLSAAMQGILARPQVAEMKPEDVAKAALAHAKAAMKVLDDDGKPAAAKDEAGKAVEGG